VLSSALCPINTYTFVLAKRESGAAAATGTLPCKYFTSLRSDNISLGYPNFTDMTNIGLDFTGGSTGDALNRTYNPTQPVATIDCAFKSFNYREKHTLTNVTNGQVTITAYWIQARRDIPKYTGSTAGGGFESYQLLDWLGAAFARSTITSLDVDGIDNTLPTTGSGEYSSTSSLMLDSQYEPRMAPLFNQYFRIRKTKNFKLGGGKIATVSMNVRRPFINSPGDYKNLLLSSSTWVYADSGSHTVWRKGSMMMLFKMIGQPVNSSATPAAVNLHTPSVNHVTSVSFNYQARLNRGGHTYAGATFGPVNLVTPQFVSDDTDAIQTVITA